MYYSMSKSNQYVETQNSVNKDNSVSKTRPKYIVFLSENHIKQLTEQQKKRTIEICLMLWTMNVLPEQTCDIDIGFLINRKY